MSSSFSKKEKGTQRVPNSNKNRNKYTKNTNKIETNIGLEAILNHTKELEEKLETNKENLASVTNILTKLLNSIEVVNFRVYANLDSDKDKLQKKHYLVSVVEVLLKTANENNLNLCRKNEMIYLFNSQYWENINTEQFKDFLGRVSLKMGVQKFDAKLHTFRDDMYKQFIADAGLKEIEPNYNTTLINLKNGTFEITPKEQFLREFKQSDFITYQLPFNYNKDALAPLFQKFLDRVLPEKELQNILAEYLGSVFIKSQILKLEKVLLLYGTGANGKSVVFDIIKALLGENNMCSYSLHSITDNNSYYRSNLSNKLLNYSSEINGKLEAQTFKQLASGEPIEVNVKYKDPFIMTDYAKLMFNTNELPKQVENTNAFFRRFIILPFRVTITDEEKDTKLAEKIIENELSGVFNWVLDGLKRLLINEDFTSSEISKNEVAQFRKESDSVLMFLEENKYTPSATNRINRTELYLKYQSHCIEFGNKPLSAGRFYKRIKNTGYADASSNGVRYIYIQN